MRTFQPALLVEVTSVCDQKCPGCYSPTRLVNFGDKLNPDLFLSVEALRLAIANSNLPSSGVVVGVRGGEPTLHPDLREILGELASVSSSLYLETNGTIFLDPLAGSDLFRVCKDLGVIVKISFDSMHQTLTHERLQTLCERLNEKGVEWTVAVTEATEEDALRTLQSCPWVIPERVFFQKKARHAHELLFPSYGVIHIDGSINLGVFTKFVKK